LCYDIPLCTKDNESLLIKKLYILYYAEWIRLVLFIYLFIFSHWFFVFFSAFFPTYHKTKVNKSLKYYLELPLLAFHLFLSFVFLFCLLLVLFFNNQHFVCLYFRLRHWLRLEMTHQSIGFVWIYVLHINWSVMNKN